MSYARFSETSKVYVYLSDSGIECNNCWLMTRGPFIAHSTDEMFDHLQAHRASGQLVPDDCFTGLEEDREENDHYLATGEWPA